MDIPKYQEAFRKSESSSKCFQKRKLSEKHQRTQYKQRYLKNIKEAAYADRKYTETGIPKTGF